MPADALVELPAAPDCPEPPPCPRCPGFDLTLELPSSWAPGQRLELKARSGWSPSSGDVCQALQAATSDGSTTSSWATLSGPADCVVVAPDAPPAVALALGLAALAALSKHGRKPETKRAGLAPT